MGPATKTRSAPNPKTGRERAKLREHQGGIRRVLICLDRSRFSEGALRNATSIATAFDSAITLLHVLQPARDSAPQPTDVCGWEISREEGRAYLEGLERATARSSGLRIDCRLEQGQPAERITSVARELDADLVALGGHGQSGLSAWTLGSTAQQVLGATRGSVLVVRGPDHTDGDGAPRRILVPLDGSSRADSVVPTAARIARAEGAEIVLAHVVSEPPTTAILSDGDMQLARQLAGRMEASATRYLQNLRDQLEREGLASRAIVQRRTDVRQSLLDLVRKEAAHLVVLSAHGTTCNPVRSFGSVTAHLLEHASAPLLVLQDLPEADNGRVKEDIAPDDAPALRASYTADEA